MQAGRYVPEAKKPDKPVLSKLRAKLVIDKGHAGKKKERKFDSTHCVFPLALKLCKIY